MIRRFLVWTAATAGPVLAYEAVERWVVLVVVVFAALATAAFHRATEALRRVDQHLSEASDETQKVRADVAKIRRTARG